MGMIANDWQPAVQAEFKKPYYKELYNFVRWYTKKKLYI